MRLAQLQNSADVHPVKVTRPQHTHVRGKVLVDPPLILALQTFHPVDTDKIRSVIKDFLSRCSIPLLMTPFDNNFLNTCCEEAGRRGYPLDSFPAATSLRPFMVGGVVMATTAYAHLPLVRTRIFIAIYTAFLIYLDDVFQSRIDAVRGFNQRFIKKQPQGDAVLDAFAGFLHEFPAHFGLVASNIMVTATLNLVTALLLEQEMRNLTVRRIFRTLVAANTQPIDSSPPLHIASPPFHAQCRELRRHMRFLPFPPTCLCPLTSKPYLKWSPSSTTESTCFVLTR